MRLAPALVRSAPLALGCAVLGGCVQMELCKHPDFGFAYSTADSMHDRIRILASDEFEGRGPGTPGEDRTVKYLERECRALGLTPGNPDGTYVQAVPLVGFTTRATVDIEVAGKRLDLRTSQDVVLVSRHQVPDTRVDPGSIVFCGYGVVAPEYGWDDFAGVDVRGKTIVVLVNDPPVVDPNDASKLDDAMFGGRAMTYYGRWTYKYEVAMEKGAAAVLIVHEDGPAGYPWEVVSGSWSRENFDIVADDKNASRPAIEGWITRAKALELLAACGQDFDALKERAAQRGFRAVELDARASFTAQNDLRRIDSRNVIARLEGADPERADEHVLYMAHWDHLGIDPARAGDQIFNGAVDNASGCAGVLEIASDLARRPRLPRSFLFLFVTAEEKGLLGSRWYAEHPLWPLDSTLCAINMDSLNVWGRTADIISVGYGSSTLDQLLVEEAAWQYRVVRSDPEPEKGYFYRSDHFELMKRGVPALYADGGVELISKPPGEGLRRAREYTRDDYHKPSDEVKDDWDLRGAAIDMWLLTSVGERVASEDGRPEWNATSEFAAIGAALRQQAP